MPESEVWKKSTFSGAGNCVEVAIMLPSGTVKVRNSRRPDGAVVTFDKYEWRAFRLGVQAGEFRLPGDLI